MSRLKSSVRSSPNSSRHGEEPEVAVDPAGADVVVARREMAVAADPVGFLAHDQAGLAVRLVARPGRTRRGRPTSSSARAQRMFASSSKRACSSTRTATSLPFSRRDGERLGDRRGRAHAVERHLDREHLGVGRRLLRRSASPRRRTGRDDGRGCRRSRIALHMSEALSKAGTGSGGERPVLQARQVDGGVELEEVGERGEPLAGVQVIRGRAPAPRRRRASTSGGSSGSYWSRTASPMRRSRRLCSMLRQQVVGAAAPGVGRRRRG